MEEQRLTETVLDYMESWLMIRQEGEKITVFPSAARTAGGVGTSGRCPDVARWSFIAFKPASTAKRIRRTAPSCSSSESGDTEKVSSNRFNFLIKHCRGSKGCVNG